VGRRDQHLVQPVQEELGGQLGVGHLDLPRGPSGLDQLGHHQAGPGEDVHLPEPGLVEQHVVQGMVGQGEVVRGGHQPIDPGGGGAGPRRVGKLAQPGREALEVAGP
jgi:hypothetical protein